LGGTVFITLPLPSWNTIAGASLILPNLASPERNSAMLVPTPPAS
jgi:hypothetical protein